ncbi:LysM peptidoglycan-binding domain-containing protein [Desulfurobacterium atlanticum]|uniref:LysM domain-containing protein n=1 Tax=Desulfurobacterium atlanticum TaxID=240169 RepID=A0A238Z316_9BACT|nr:LysM peptidoglycan-binding domain-containing protein [Desulfurobacterium atlanticum]SNR77746.1 LysM domain-containing protein [Desulfurobacterium atlanticum]
MRKLTGILTAFVIGASVSTSIAATSCPSNISNYTTCVAENTTKIENKAPMNVENEKVTANTYAELEEKYQKALEEYNKLKAQLEKEEQELAMLKAKEADLLRRYNLLSQEVAELKKEIEYRKQLEAKIAALKAKLKKAESKVEKLRRAFMALPKSYRVVKGDTLWGIASKSYIYNDPWQWPLIYKANRDQIKNPHLIYPNQVFAIPRNITAEKVIEARKEALRTPPPPGVKPKKVGPVRAEDVPSTATDYFLFMHE